MMKRLTAIMLIFIMLISTCVSVFADNEGNNEAEAYKITPAQIEINADAAYLMDAESGTVLLSYNEKNQASPASVTKIMTLLLVCEAIESGQLDLNSEISISKHAASMGGSQVFLEEGERMGVRDLIKSAVIASANDAAVALAEAVAGSEDAFVYKMNERARALQMNNSSFENATGLDDTTSNHYSCAEDIAIMSRELIKHELITEYSSLWQDTIRNGEFTLTNTNRLVRFYDGCTGLKTGSTDKAGFCMSATAKRGDMHLIAVVMGADTRDDRNELARRLLDCGFANYAVYKSERKTLESVPVLSGTSDSVEVVSPEFCAVVDRKDLAKVSVSYDIPKNLIAPVLSASEVGSAVYTVDGKILGKTGIFASEGIPEITVSELYSRILRACLTGASKKEE